MCWVCEEGLSTGYSAHVSAGTDQLADHTGICQDKLDFGAQVRLLLAGKDATPSECALHPGRIVCQVERLLSA